MYALFMLFALLTTWSQARILRAGRLPGADERRVGRVRLPLGRDDAVAGRAVATADAARAADARPRALVADGRPRRRGRGPRRRAVRARPAQAVRVRGPLLHRRRAAGADA